MMKKKHFGMLIGVVSFVVCSLLFFVSLVHAFTGPTTSAGTGSGSVGSDAANNVAVGTSTTNANTKMLIVASSTDSSNYALKVMNSTQAPVLFLRNDGSVGIGTSTLGAGTLTVQGTIFSTGNFTGNLSAANVSASNFASSTGGGNFSFPSSLGISTTTNVGLPSTLSVYGTFQALSSTIVGGISQSLGPNTFASTTISGNATATTLSVTGASSHGGTATFTGAISQSGAINALATTTIAGQATTTNLSITALGGASGCLSVTSSGAVVTSTCSGGSGITSLNGLSGSSQTFSTSTTLVSGFDIRSSGSVHTIYISGGLSQLAGLATSTGNLIVGSSTSGWNVLGVGTNGKVLTASSTAINGVSWEPASGGSLSGGTANWLPMWTSASALGTSTLLQNGTTTYSLNGIAIGTTTLQSAGSIYATGGIVANNFAGNLSATYVTAGAFPSGNYSFPGSLGVNTSTNVSLPQQLSVYGNAYFSKNISIGTTTPTDALIVTNASGTAVLDVSTTTASDNVFEVADKNNVVQLSVSTSGFVGVGTQYPSSTLHVLGSITQGSGSNSIATTTFNGAVTLASTTFTSKATLRNLLNSSGTVDQVSVCGNGPSIVGANGIGRVTAGNPASSTCTITFGTAFLQKPVCTIRTETAAQALSTSTIITPAAATLKISQSSSTQFQSAVFDYICIGID